MEKDGLIESYEQVENGRTRRYYRLTPAGQTALAQEQAQWEQFVSSVNLVLGGTS
jgi:PadR family transcriptional regulator PadR